MGLDRESQQIGLICPSGNQIDPDSTNHAKRAGRVSPTSPREP
jgi:hypothetical protein